MKTLEQLQEENRKLRAKREVQLAFKERNRERKKLVRENRALKHAGKIEFARTVGKYVGRGGSAFGRGLKSLVVAPPRKRRR